MNKLYVDSEDHPVVEELMDRLTYILDGRCKNIYLYGWKITNTFIDKHWDKKIHKLLQALDCIEVLDEGMIVALTNSSAWDCIYGHDAG